MGRMGRRATWREYLEALLVAVILALFVRTFVFQAFKIPTGSMEENLLVGDHILVNKFIYGPATGDLERALLPQRELRHGDVVVFKFPDNPRRDFIKRCVGLPGDEIEIVDKELFVNGEPVDDDSYTYHRSSEVYPRSRFAAPQFSRRDNFGPYLVPPGGYFFLGDNRDDSQDSRFWERTTAPRAYVKGRAVLIYWSFDPGRAGIPPGSSPRERLASVVRNFGSATRWDRSGRVVR